MKRLHYFAVILMLSACHREPINDHPVITYYNNGFDLLDSLEMKRVNFRIDSTLQTNSSAYLLTIAHYLKGYISYREKRLNDAYGSWQKANELYHESDTTDLYYEVAIQKNLGAIHDRMEDYKGAIAHYEKGLPKAEEYSKKEVLSLKANIGLALTKIDLDTVPSIFFDVLELAEELGDKKKIIQTNMRLGNRLVDVKRWGEAESHLQYAYTIARQENETNYISAISHNLGRCLFLQKKYKVATPYFEESINYAKYRFISLMDLGECHLMLGDTARAVSIWKQAERYFEQESNTPENYKLFRFLAEYDRENSTSYYQKYITQNEVFLTNQAFVKHADASGMNFLQNYQKRKAEIAQEKKIKQWIYSISMVMLLFLMGWFVSNRLKVVTKKRKRLETDLRLKTIQDKINNIEKLF